MNLRFYIYFTAQEWQSKIGGILLLYVTPFEYYEFVLMASKGTPVKNLLRKNDQGLTTRQAVDGSFIYDHDMN